MTPYDMTVWSLGTIWPIDTTQIHDWIGQLQDAVLKDPTFVRKIKVQIFYHFYTKKGVYF